MRSKLQDLALRNELREKARELKLVQEERDLAVERQAFEEKMRTYDQRMTWFLVGSLLLVIGVVIFGLVKMRRRA